MADKINPNSSSTKQLMSEKVNRENTSVVPSEISSDNSDDDLTDYNNNVSSSELFAKILENIGSVENRSRESEISQPQASVSSASTDLYTEINDLLLQGESEATLLKQDSNEDEDSRQESKEKDEIPEGGIEIHIPGKDLVSDRKIKKQQDLQKLLQNKINQRMRLSQLLVHKVSLLCWLIHGFSLNKLANDPDLLAVALSLVSSDYYPKGQPDLNYLESFTKWFSSLFKIYDKHKNIVYNNELLIKTLLDKKIYNYLELILLFIATLRGMGFNCRLVISLQPPPLKPRSDQLFKVQKTEENSVLTPKKEATDEKETKLKKSTSKSNKVAQTKGKIDKARPKSKLSNNLKEEKTSKSEKIRAEHSKNTSERETKSEIDILSPKKRHSSLKSMNVPEEETDFSTDDEYMYEMPKKKATKKSKSTKNTNKEEELLPPSNEEDENVWVEVYVESEQSWICVNIVDQKINCISEIYQNAGNPVLYIVSWNTAGRLKDVTRRYCPHYLNDTRKKRVDEQWWSDTLSYWKEKKSSMSKGEDEQFLQKELENPLPKTISECKGHPLYVLTRHLLKFEALYPPDAVPLGYLKCGEAIYSRRCVHTLCCREKWFIKARVVKPAEEAYKIVKSMPKYDKLSGMKIKGLPLELFGKWQTTRYVPPEAKDGKVPRNEYGNVDLFKRRMIPKGTVYVNLPGLKRIAQKLNIDCAPACVGFNFGYRSSAPMLEGFIVCKEYESVLRKAWKEEHIKIKAIMKEKREKRIYGNWKKLIKGLFIREKLAAKYNFGNDNDHD